MAGPATAEKHETLTFNPNIREFDDTVTWLAEILDGQMKSEFTYNFDGENLISRDGSNLKDVFENSIVDAEEKAKADPRYQFELRRRRIEHEEYLEIVEMAKGQTDHNSIIVVSDFPKEVEALRINFGGYNLGRRQTMLRVVTKNSDGSITMTSQTLDQSNRQALEKIYGFFNKTPNYGELLGQRIHAKVDLGFLSGISDALTRVYDYSLIEQYGGDWYAGRSDSDRRNTMHFALQQTDLIDYYLSGPKDQPSQYDLSASIVARFEGRSRAITTIIGNQIMLDVDSNLYAEMKHWGALARSEGRSFSGCGVTMNAELELSQLGYGDFDKKHEKQEWYGSHKKKGTCVNCKVDTEVGEKSWCKACIKGHCG